MKAAVPMVAALVLAGALVAQAAPSAAQEFGLALSEAERAQLGAPQAVVLTGAELAWRAQEVGGLLRCPVCQGLSIAASPVPAAQSMQAKVRDLLAAGYSEDQILTFFESSYGEFVRLSPKAEGFNLVVWILPLVAVLLGVLLIVRRVRSVPAPADDEALETYRQRVREELES